MLKLEQAGERLHSQLNAIERRFYNVKNKALQFWYILLEYENMLNCNFDYFKVKKKGKLKTNNKKITKGWVQKNLSKNSLIKNKLFLSIYQIMCIKM